MGSDGNLREFKQVKANTKIEHPSTKCKREEKEQRTMQESYLTVTPSGAEERDAFPSHSVGWWLFSNKPRASKDFDGRVYGMTGNII